MVTCEVDPEISGELLGLRLPTWQALLLHRVLPSCGGLVVYLTVTCSDIALIYEHYNNGHTGVGAFCIVLMVFPALLTLVFTLASPPPGLQTDSSTWKVTMQKTDVKWLVMQFVNCLFFPVAAIGRYMHQIFWWTEVVFAVRAEDHPRTKEALRRARWPSPLELYLFLQAFTHSAPHAIVNILDLMTRFNNPAFGKVSVQAMSIVASVMRMASTATIYRRFEREKICGRKYPWQTKVESKDENKAIEVEKQLEEPILNKPSLSSQQSTESRNNANSDLIRFSSTKATDSDRVKANSDLIQFSPTEDLKSHPWDEEYYSDSGTSSDFVPNEAYRASRRSASLNSDEEYLKPISIIDKVAPRRRAEDFPIERVEIVPPPIIPAPRPMSLAVWAERMVENAENIPAWLSAPQRRRHGDQYSTVIPEEPELPRRVPRSFMRGLEPQDFTAMLIQYLGWYAFFISRLLSIAAFLNSVPVAAIIILMSHYQVMLLFLIVPQASTVRRAFYIFLAFIYLFCLMEFKIRFRHVRVWHVYWIIVCTIETIVFISVWAIVGNNFSDWWRGFIVKIVFYNLILSYMCLLFFFVLLKPRETIVYINRNNNDDTAMKVKSIHTEI
ncbi:hypothetical protein O0L34_g3973 [Tuta absoluta]|nr:hypothetical protein O0L34_g3973 [Tuta absoluta]